MPLKIIYWISTALLTALYLASATFYITQGDVVRHLLGNFGFPPYLVPILLSVKILGLIAILSRVNVALSDLAYAGMFFHLLLAVSAHLNAGDQSGAAPGVIGVCLVIASFLTQNSVRKRPSPYALKA